MAKQDDTLRLCADRILQRMEFMTSGCWLTSTDFEQLSAELAVILNEITRETLLNQQDLIDYCEEYCDLDK